MLTGTETRPKEIVAVAIERAGMERREEGSGKREEGRGKKVLAGDHPTIYSRVCHKNM